MFALLVALGLCGDAPKPDAPWGLQEFVFIYPVYDEESGEWSDQYWGCSWDSDRECYWFDEGFDGGGSGEMVYLWYDWENEGYYWAGDLDTPVWSGSSILGWLTSRGWAVDSETYEEDWDRTGYIGTVVVDPGTGGGSSGGGSSGSGGVVSPVAIVDWPALVRVLLTSTPMLAALGLFAAMFSLRVGMDHLIRSRRETLSLRERRAAIAEAEAGDSRRLRRFVKSQRIRPPLAPGLKSPPVQSEWRKRKRKGAW